MNMGNAIPNTYDGVHRAPRWLRRLEARHVVGGVIAVMLALVSSPLWLRYVPESLVYCGEFREARTVIKRIDDFTLARGNLPQDLCALGLPYDESAPLHYQTTSGGYELWFGTPTHGFFSALVYDRTWRVAAH